MNLVLINFFAFYHQNSIVKKICKMRKDFQICHWKIELNCWIKEGIQLFKTRNKLIWIKIRGNLEDKWIILMKKIFECNWWKKSNLSFIVFELFIGNLNNILTFLSWCIRLWSNSPSIYNIQDRSKSIEILNRQSIRFFFHPYHYKLKFQWNRCHNPCNLNKYKKITIQPAITSQLYDTW